MEGSRPTNCAALNDFAERQEPRSSLPCTFSPPSEHSAGVIIWQKTHRETDLTAAIMTRMRHDRCAGPVISVPTQVLMPLWIWVDWEGVYVSLSPVDWS